MSKNSGKFKDNREWKHGKFIIIFLSAIIISFAVANPFETRQGRTLPLLLSIAIKPIFDTADRHSPASSAASLSAGTSRSAEITNNHLPTADDNWITRKMIVTAYCPCRICCDKSADGITASGHKVKSGDRFVAAPRSLPFGSKLRIPGYARDTPVLCLDRGGAIKGNKLDVFFNTHKEARAWGVQKLKVRIEK